MVKLPSTTTTLAKSRSFFSSAWEVIKIAIHYFWAALKIIWGIIRSAYEKTRGWARVRLPFVEALIQRHIHNPATVFIDIAAFVLVIYLIFGVTGYFSVYQKKSESRFTETLTILYPLPAARVDSSFIWTHTFLQRLRFLNTFNQQAPKEVSSRPPTDSELRQKVAAGLIEDRIVFLEARKRGISVTSEELESTYTLQKKQIEGFEEKIEQLYGMSVTDFKGVLAEQILKEKVKSVALTRVKVRHILTATLSAAEDAKRQVESGRSFDDTAREFSQDTQTKEAGGDLGYWTKGELASLISPGFEEAAFNLTIDAPSSPVQSKFGYHIIQVNEKTGDNYQTYTEWYDLVKPSYKISTYIPL
jgi:hypothetical protein